MRILGSLLLLALSNSSIANQEEIKAALEGAPSHISKNASVMVWKDGSYIKKVKGTNQFSCLVWEDKQGTFEPSCFNQAAMKSVLPVYEFQRNMLEKGKSIENIFSEIEKKAKAGDFVAPKPGAVVYMMSKRNKFYDHFDKKLLTIEPHIMLYYPKIEASTLEFNGQEGLPGFYSDFPHLSVVHIHTDQNQAAHNHSN